MDDRTLMRVSIIIAVAGLAGLIGAAEFIRPENVEISQITNAMIGKIVVVNGTVHGASIKDGNVFITLAAGNSSVDVVLFEQEAKRVEDAYVIRKSDFIEVSGKVGFYRNSLEVVASSIRRIYSNTTK